MWSDLSVSQTKFTSTETGKPQMTSAGENETQESGRTGTQSPKTYSFPINDTVVQIIDTPGVGDIRGHEQDRDNLQSILIHLSNFHTLHGIVILLNPKHARFSLIFTYVINELLHIMHKHACHNIIFCFRKSQATYYNSDEAVISLKRLLRDNKVTLKLNRETIYCIDNRALMYLAGVQNGVKFTTEERSQFSMSWDISVQETERILHHILSCPPHLVQDMLAINDSKQIILALSQQLDTISTPVTEAVQRNVEPVEWPSSFSTFPTDRSFTKRGLAAKFDKKEKLGLSSCSQEYSSSYYVCKSASCIHGTYNGLTLKVTYKCVEHINDYQLSLKNRFFFRRSVLPL